MRQCKFSAFLLVFSTLVCASIFSPLFSQEKFYNYYNEGLEYMEKGDWMRAEAAFESAISLEFEDTKRKRTYGTRFIRYYPHRELGIAYYNLGEYDHARKELELSIAYRSTKRAEDYLKRLPGPADIPEWEEMAAAEELKKMEEEKVRLRAEEERLARERKQMALEEARKREEELRSEQEELKRQRALLEEEKRRAEEKKAASLAVARGLAYDVSRVTRVGSRLSVAVLPFDIKGMAPYAGETVTEKLITQLVNLRRFKVIERQAMTAIMEEQALAQTGVMDEKTAVMVGKIVGADVIVLGSTSVVPGFGKVSARLIDTETTETIVAKEAQTQDPNIGVIEKLVEDIAVMIYNDLPIAEGYIVKVEPDMVYLDIGTGAGVRKGTKCVAFTEGDEIVHPITGEILGKEVTKLGELVVVQVQEKLALARFAGEETGTVKLGDKVVVK